MPSVEAEKAFEETIRLFKERSTSDAWGQNLIEGSRFLQTDDDWNTYIRFLANPAGRGREVNPEHAQMIIESCSDENQLANGMKETRYLNGNECVIHVHKYDDTDDDEKSPL